MKKLRLLSAGHGLHGRVRPKKIKNSHRKFYQNNNFWRFLDSSIIVILILDIVFCGLISNLTPWKIPLAQAAIAQVQTKTATTYTSTSVSATLTSTPIENNLLVAAVSTYSNLTITAPSGWSTAINQSGTPSQAIFYKVAGVSESKTVTATISATDVAGIHLYEVSGLATSAPLDQTSSSAGSAKAAVSGTITTTQAREWIFVATTANDTGGNSYTKWSNSFTERNDFSATNGDLTITARDGGATRTVTAIGSYSTAGTISTSNVAYRGQIASFKQGLPTFTQSGYRLYANTDTTDVGAAMANLNTAATLSNTGDAFRLRLLIHMTSFPLDASADSFKLQFAQQSGTCDTAFSGESYADVTADTVIAYKNNATPADGANLTANANDPTHSSDTVVAETYEEANNFTNSRAAVPAGQDGLWDFALYDHGATAGTAYCLKVVKSDGTALDTTSVVPQITTAASAGSLSVDIVDGSGVSVGSPSVTMNAATYSFAYQTVTGTLGTASQKIRVTNTTATATWTMAIAGSATTAVWTDSSHTYDFNDSTASAGDGADADSVGGQLTINPSGGTITPQDGCSSTGVSLGSSSAFVEDTTNSITLASAGGTASTNCYWDFTGISLSQTVPASQNVSTYTISLTITVS
ncbi:MAG: hypothetical protein V1846_03575 [Candidatus Komeilibacteria bacterium]